MNRRQMDNKLHY